MKVILGISGSIAAYKAANIGRLLKKRGADIRIILTNGAQKFVSPLLFKSLLECGVYTEDEYWDYKGGLHIQLAQWGDVLLIAPATLNTISKLAQGIADNLLTSTAAAFKGPVVLAPAMHTEMWNNPILQQNIKKLLQMSNFYLSGPGEGELASGDKGIGRLLEEEFIVEDTVAALKGFPLKNKKILLTYGRTEEYIDDVRVITNRSSGLMGISLAKKVKEMGGQLTQVVGETSYPPYGRDRIIRVKTTQEMLEVLEREIENHDILIMAAAVSDYAPYTKIRGKIKKTNELTLHLKENPDILKHLSNYKGKRLFIGFALEADNIIENARAKLNEKSLDIIVANSIGSMGSSRTSGYIISSTGVEVSFLDMDKDSLAEKILEHVIKLYGK